MEIRVSTPEQTSNLAQSIASKLLPGDVLALSGDLGVGKTFFTHELVKFLGINKRVQSPTFVLVRQYFDEKVPGPVKKVYHVDLYRLESEAEVLDLGLESYFNDHDAITVIEWPALAKSILPPKTIFISFELEGDARRIYVQNLR